MKTYRTAIIGMRGIGSSVAKPPPNPVLGQLIPASHVENYALLPQTELVAVCDLVPDLLEGFRRDFGATLPNVNIYADYREMLSKERIDILSVATSDHVHAQMTVDGVEAGAKGILCEKPIATTLADADRMIAACERAGVPLMIHHNRRWEPEYQQARELIRSGEIGELRLVFATLGGPRAMLFRNGTHLIDLLCFFADADPAWVMGDLDDHFRDYGPRYAGTGGRDATTDPGCSAYVHFENGVRAFINISKNAPQNFELELVCENGRIRIGRHVGEVWRMSPPWQASVSRLQPEQTTRINLLAAIPELIDMIETGRRECTSSARDGRRTLSIILGILHSNVAGSSRIDFPIQDM
jgi:predicted dehydrogenase